MNLEQLVRVFRLRGGFEMVNHQESPNQLRMLGRVARPSVDGWLLVVHHLIRVSSQTGWNVDISKPYLDRGGKLRYAWRIILQAENVSQFYSQVAQTVTGAPRARTIIEEVALPGGRGERNAPSAANRGKGAQGVLGAKVGPFALAAIQSGS